MTLIVSLRTPDGIVIAGDSLASMVTQRNFQTQITLPCPHCGKDHPINIDVPLPPLPATTFSYAQKVFPFLKKYGVGTFGMGMLTGKSIYFIIREFEQIILRDPNTTPVSGVTDAAHQIGHYVYELFKQQVAAEGRDLDTITGEPLGLQIAGYDESQAKTIEIGMGKTLTIKDPHEGAGCMMSGQHHVAGAIATLYNQPDQRPAFGVFSLQDAIAYAEFLIKTTALHQKFSATMPGVGGDIDIALITPFDGFRWIRQKSLTKLLEEHHDIT